MSGADRLPSWPCYFGCGARVSREGTSCWPCQSYEAYLMQPRCDCPHDPNVACRCEPECEEDCPAEEYAIGGPEMRGFDDGE